MKKHWGWPTKPEDDQHPIVFVRLESMEGLDFCIRYFDDPSTMYMSPEVYDRQESGEKFTAKYYILGYTKKQKDIEDVVEEIQEEVAKLPNKQLNIDIRDYNTSGKVNIKSSPLKGD